MSDSRFHIDDTALVVIDIQPSLQSVVADPHAADRAAFLVRCAGILGVPILATEQNPERLGHLDPILREAADHAIPKMEFSAFANPVFQFRWEALGHKKAVICGYETHICVAQTVADMRAHGIAVGVALDACSARSPVAHEIGVNRLAFDGAVPLHSESIVYEWLARADHPKFRDVLALVKAGSAPA